MEFVFEFELDLEMVKTEINDNLKFKLNSDVVKY